MGSLPSVGSFPFRFLRAEASWKWAGMLTFVAEFNLYQIKILNYV